MIIEQKHRTPKVDVAAPKPHLKPVGDLVLHLMTAKQDDSGADRTASRNIELMSQLLVWIWEGDILMILNFGQAFLSKHGARKMGGDIFIGER